jgi:hypothetical protein
MASEDSRISRPAFPIHPLRDESDFSEATVGQVSSALHQLEDLDEQPEVGVLGGSQWMLLETRCHDVHEIFPSFHGETR